MTEQPVVTKATRDNLAPFVLEGSRKEPVLVSPCAEWAKPSLRQSELLLGLEREYAGRFVLVAVDTDPQRLRTRPELIRAARSAGPEGSLQADLTEAPDCSENRSVLRQMPFDC